MKAVELAVSQKGCWRNIAITLTLRELKPAELFRGVRVHPRFSNAITPNRLAKEQSRAMTLAAVPMAAVRIQSVKRTPHWFLAQTGQS